MNAPQDRNRVVVHDGAIKVARSYRALPAILFIGAAVRVLPLGSQSLWFDEVFTFDASSGSLRQLFDLLIKDAQHPPFHYLVEWLALRIDSSDIALRAPSAVFGCATVALTYLLALRCADSVTATVAATLVSVSPFQVYYSHEARNYAMLCALVLASSWLLLRWMEGGGSGWLYLACIIAGLYTSNLMAATIIAHGLFLKSTRSALLRMWAAYAVVAFLSYGIWFALIHRYAHRLTPGHGSAEAAAAMAFGIPMDFSIGYFRGFSMGIGRASEILVGALLFGGVTALAYTAFALASRENRQSVWFLLWSLFIPVALALFLAYKTHFHQSRYAMPAHPFFVIALAWGVTRAWTRNPVLCAPFLLIAFLNVIGLRNYLVRPEYHRDDFRALARFMERELKPEDLIIFVAPQEDRLLRHYLKTSFHASGLPREVVPVEQQDSEEFRQEVQRDVDRLVTRSRERIWLVLCYDEVADNRGLVKKRLDGHAQPAWHGSFAGWPRPVRVYRYDFERRI